MMENKVGSFTGGATGIEIANISLDHPEGRRFLHWTVNHFIQVRAVTGRKIVYSNHVLAKRQQLLKQTGSNEPSDSAYEPPSWSSDEIVAKTSVRCGVH